jgi:hypothetical protein
LFKIEVSKWEYHGDWENAELSIQSVNSNGSFQGSISSEPIRGKFLESTGEINFTRQGSSDEVTHVYSGLMTRLQTETDYPEYFLAGSYLKIEKGALAFSKYGWYATRAHTGR